jgi:hypothetical protein
MIIVKLQGGLGNQIFQWAYGRFLSEKYNTPLYLDLIFFQNNISDTKRLFSLNKFSKIKFQILPKDRNISNLSNEPEKIKLQQLGDNFIFNELYYEDDTHYYLDGYWQSEKYFKEIKDVIKSELSSNFDFSNSLALPIKDNNISIHIRRTDYITSNGYHPVQSIQYYKDALKLIGDYDNIFVFSDDIEWCKQNLEFEKMIFIEGFDDVEDLWIMSMCKNNIIANSSFSWWGA